MLLIKLLPQGALWDEGCSWILSLFEVTIKRKNEARKKSEKKWNV
jgi:hypothetical protein